MEKTGRNNSGNKASSKNRKAMHARAEKKLL
jgi:hypothetical protein